VYPCGGMTQPSDSHIYNDVLVPAYLLELFANASRFYASLLEHDIATFQLDEELARLFDAQTLDSFHMYRDIDEVRRIAERAEKLLPAAKSMGSMTMPMSHGHVRLLKAMSLLYIGELEHRRNAAAVGRTLTARALRIIDARLVEMREAMDMGILGHAEPVPLLVAAEAAERPSQAAKMVTVTTGAGVVSIDLIDQELRSRCLDLFNNFSDEGPTTRFDTIVAEATRILEDRIRKISGLGPDSAGLDLVSTAFGGKSPRLRVSGHSPEQEGIHHLFRGVVGFIRNPVHHRLEKIEKERAVQIVGFIDYLLHVAASAEVTTA
jgi:hypothetical protein